MKKKKLTIALIVLAVILVFPVYTGTFKDGGTKTFSALTYKIVSWNRLTDSGTYSQNRVYLFPHNFRSIGSLWAMENRENNKENDKIIEETQTGKAILLEGKTEEATTQPQTDKPDKEVAVSDPTYAVSDPTYVAVSDPTYVAVSDPTQRPYLKETVAQSTAASVIVHGTVRQVRNKTLLVAVGENKSLYDFTIGEKTKLRIDGETAALEDFKIGDEVKIHFDFPIAETYPAQVFSVRSVEKQ